MESFVLSVSCEELLRRRRRREGPRGGDARMGKRVMLAYGGGSVKRSGLYDQIRGLLEDAARR